ISDVLTVFWFPRLFFQADHYTFTFVSDSESGIPSDVANVGYTSIPEDGTFQRVGTADFPFTNVLGQKLILPDSIFNFFDNLRVEVRSCAVEGNLGDFGNVMKRIALAIGVALATPAEAADLSDPCAIPFAGPILPALMLACVGLFAWWRRHN